MKRQRWWLMTTASMWVVWSVVVASCVVGLRWWAAMVVVLVCLVRGVLKDLVGYFGENGENGSKIQGVGTYL